jgi:hypothetical protein
MDENDFSLSKIFTLNGQKIKMDEGNLVIMKQAQKETRKQKEREVSYNSNI